MKIVRLEQSATTAHNHPAQLLQGACAFRELTTFELMSAAEISRASHREVLGFVFLMTGRLFYVEPSADW